MNKIFLFLRIILISIGFVSIRYFVPKVHDLTVLKYGQSGTAWISFIFFTLLNCIIVIYLSLSDKVGKKTVKEKLLGALVGGVFLEVFVVFSLLGDLYGKGQEMASWSFTLMAIWGFFGLAGAFYIFSRIDKSKKNDISYLESIKGVGIIFIFIGALTIARFLVEKLR